MAATGVALPSYTLSWELCAEGCTSGAEAAGGHAREASAHRRVEKGSTAERPAGGVPAAREPAHLPLAAGGGGQQEVWLLRLGLPQPPPRPPHGPTAARLPQEPVCHGCTLRGESLTFLQPCPFHQLLPRNYFM